MTPARDESEETGAPETDEIDDEVLDDEVLDDEVLDDDIVDYDVEVSGDGQSTSRRSISPAQLALVVGLVFVVALAGLTGWLGLRASESRRVDNERAKYIDAARDGAVNMTTIDFQHADADVQRILASATGQFHDEFAANSQAFVEAARKSHSTSVGTVTEAALESMTDHEATAIVAVSVNSSQAGSPEPVVRSWRMRMTVEKDDDNVKVSHVTFMK